MKNAMVFIKSYCAEMIWNRSDVKRTEMIQSRRSFNKDGLSEQFKRIKLKILKILNWRILTWTIMSQSNFGRICPSASDYVSIKVIWCKIEVLLLTWCQNIPYWWNHATWWVIIPCVNIKFVFHLDWLSLNYDQGSTDRQALVRFSINFACQCGPSFWSVDPWLWLIQNLWPIRKQECLQQEFEIRTGQMTGDYHWNRVQGWPLPEQRFFILSIYISFEWVIIMIHKCSRKSMIKLSFGNFHQCWDTLIRRHYRL